MTNIGIIHKEVVMFNNNNNNIRWRLIAAGLSYHAQYLQSLERIKQMNV
jgi:hypothetical protein